MAFFGMTALVLILLAAVFFEPILVKYLRTGVVTRMPSLIVCGFVAIAAILSFFAGMILHSFRRKNLQDFEMRLIDIDHSK